MWYIKERFGFLFTIRMPCKDSGQTARMSSLIKVFSGRTRNLVEVDVPRFVLKCFFFQPAFAIVNLGNVSRGQETIGKRQYDTSPINSCFKLFKEHGNVSYCIRLHPFKVLKCFVHKHKLYDKVYIVLPKTNHLPISRSILSSSALSSLYRVFLCRLSPLTRLFFILPHVL